MEHLAREWLIRFGPVGLFALQMLGIFGLPIPDETILVLAGVMIKHGQLHLATTTGAAVAGAIVGISVSFALGRAGGRALLSRSVVRRYVSRSALDRAERWFTGLGRWLLVCGYFIPGVRHVTAIVAGASGLSPRTFALFASLGAVLWVSCFLWIGYALADEWRAILAALHTYAPVVVVAGAAGLVAYGLWLTRGRSRT